MRLPTSGLYIHAWRGDVIAALGYLYMNIPELKKPIRVYNDIEICTMYLTFFILYNYRLIKPLPMNVWGGGG